MFSVIIAMTRDGGIGMKGQLPWKCPDDMKYFRKLTSSVSNHCKQNAIIMGRKTWESIDKIPLPNRLNVVLTRSSDQLYPSGVLVFSSFPDALKSLGVMRNVESIFVIGGSNVYAEAVHHPQCRNVHRTFINENAECDIFVSTQLPRGFEITSIIPSESKTCEFQTWTQPIHPPNIEEQQYLDIVKDILQTGHNRGDRTGTGVISKFGYTMRFDLSQGRFPLLTTKKVFFRGVAEELLWFLKGHTNAKLLRDCGVKIWDGNASRAYLDLIGLKDREEDDLGPIYGFQWRHFGAKYKTMYDDYAGQGVDQIQNLIQQIRQNPEDRRLVLSAWNPTDIPSMALPPCHCLCQFYVQGGKLSCQMYQRSCDMGLGVPFNIASYALLTCIMAHMCDLQPGEFIHVLGDAHVYMNHIDAIRQQIERPPRDFPTLSITATHKNFEQLQIGDFVINNYNPWEKITMLMAV